MKHLLRLSLLIGFIFLSVYSHAQKQQEKIKPNLLFVFSDQQRRSAVGFMNEDPVVTPHLDKLAEEGIAFTNAISNSPLCTPYRASLLTGMYAHSNGVLQNGASLTKDYKTIAQVLKESGYFTGFVGKWHLSEKNYVAPEDRGGFDFWHANKYNGDHFLIRYWRDDPKKPYVDKEGWNMTHEVDVSIEFLDKALAKNEPFALFWAPHAPHSNDEKGYARHDFLKQHTRLRGEFYKRDDYYTAPEKYMEPYYNMKFERRPNVPVNGNGGTGGLAIEACPGYFGMVNAIDDEFGRLLQYLENEDPRYPGKKLKETTIVVFTSDHGEMLGSHSATQKGIFYEEAIGVPFIISWPGHFKKDIKYDKLFATVDIMPSLLGAMNLPIPVSVEGKDFSPVFNGEKFKAPNSAYLTYFTGWWDKEREPAEGYWRGVKTESFTYAIGLRSFYKGRHITNMPESIKKIDRNSDEKVELLFDNEKDPYQMHPIVRGASKKYDVVFDELKSALMKYLVQTNDPWKNEI